MLENKENKTNKDLSSNFKGNPNLIEEEKRGEIANEGKVPEDFNPTYESSR